MKFKDKITVYHFEKEKINIMHFSNIYVKNNKNIGINNTGEQISNAGIALIPTTETLNINTGDYLLLELTDKNYDPMADNYQITGVSDNRRGSIPHYKLYFGM